MKDKQISLKKLIRGLKNDIKAEKLSYNPKQFPNTSYDEQCCSLIRIAYIKDLIKRLEDQEEDLINPESLYQGATNAQNLHLR